MTIPTQKSLQSLAQRFQNHQNAYCRIAFNDDDDDFLHQASVFLRRRQQTLFLFTILDAPFLGGDWPPFEKDSDEAANAIMTGTRALTSGASLRLPIRRAADLICKELWIIIMTTIEPRRAKHCSSSRRVCALQGPGRGPLLRVWLLVPRRGFSSMCPRAWEKDINVGTWKRGCFSSRPWLLLLSCSSKQALIIRAFFVFLLLWKACEEDRSIKFWLN